MPRYTPPTTENDQTSMLLRVELQSPQKIYTTSRYCVTALQRANENGRVIAGPISSIMSTIFFWELKFQGKEKDSLQIAFPRNTTNPDPDWRPFPIEIENASVWVTLSHVSVTETEQSPIKISDRRMGTRAEVSSDLNVLPPASVKLSCHWNGEGRNSFFTVHYKFIYPGQQAPDRAIPALKASPLSDTPRRFFINQRQPIAIGSTCKIRVIRSGKPVVVFEKEKQIETEYRLDPLTTSDQNMMGLAQALNTVLSRVALAIGQAATTYVTYLRGKLGQRGIGKGYVRVTSAALRDIPDGDEITLPLQTYPVKLGRIDAKRAYQLYPAPSDIETTVQSAIRRSDRRALLALMQKSQS